MQGKTLALVTVSGVLIITVADAPNWELDAYAGWLGAMAGVSFLGAVNSSLGGALAGLLMATLILRRGEKLTNAVTGFFIPSHQQQVTEAVTNFAASHPLG